MKPIIPEAALGQHIAVLGKTRSGKSSVMRGLVEGLLDREQPVCIVDPKGDWWGIKLSKDGKRPGYPVVIFGGEHADVPINAHAGAHVAELFATGNRPCLIDLGGWMVGERTRFWIDFASNLFKHTKGMRWLAVDEIHNFAPKGKIMDPNAGKALHWANRLASEGLGKGVHMIFASQRPQKVHNDTLTSAETLIAMRVLHPSDRGAVSDWIKGCGDLELGAKVLNSLAQMDRGEGWVWSPEIGFGPERVKFPMFKTYDSFRPQSAEDAAALKGWAEVDLEDVKAKLATVVKEAEANDPKLLRAEVARLKAQLSKAERIVEVGVIDPTKLIEAENRGYRAGKEEVLRALLAVPQYLANIQGGIDSIIGAIDLIEKALKDVGSAKAILQPAPVSQVYARRHTPAPRPVAATDSGGAKRRVMIALAQNPDGLAARKLSILADVKRGGSTWRAAMAALRRDQQIEENGEFFRLNRAGVQALGAYEPLPTGEELREHWRAKMGNATRLAVFDAIVAAFPKSISAADVAQRASVELGGSTWRAHMAYLRGLELVNGSAELRASEDLFA